MNKSNLKSYAPQARKDFIAAVTARANLLGLADKAGTVEVAVAQTQVGIPGDRDRSFWRIVTDDSGLS